MSRAPFFQKVSKFIFRAMVTKFFSLIVLLTTLMLPVNVFAANPASLSLSPSTNTYNRGCNFSLDIILDTGSLNTDGTDVVLRYDTSILTATSINQGSIYSSYPSKSIDTTGGVINISGLASADQPFNGSGTFSSVNFLVNPTTNTGVTQIKFDFTQGNTKDSNVVQTGQVVDILGSVTNGTYTITTGSCSGGGGNTITPTPAPVGNTGGTVTSYPPGTYIPAGGISPGGYYYPQGATGSGNLPTYLPKAGVSTPTLILAIAGSFLVIAGILGLALL